MLKLAARIKALSPKTRRMFFGLAFATLGPVVSAIFAGFLEARLQVQAPNMVFLCSVILAAIWFGRRIAVAAAIFAFVVYNFYLVDPRNTFGFAGLEDALTLLVFVGAALLIGGLAGTLHDERDRAEEQVRLFASLFRASRLLAECGETREALRVLSESVGHVAAKEAVLFERDEDGELVRTLGDAKVELPATVLETALRLLNSSFATDQCDSWRLQVVSIGTERIGVLAWRPGAASWVEQQVIAIGLLAELTSVAIERMRITRSRLQMDTLAGAEKLRTALMSSISHDFRTPLATILASASSLLDYGEQFTGATKADLLHNIQEEAERLNRFVTNIMQMNRLDAGVLQPRLAWTDPLEVLENVAEHVKRRIEERPLDILAPAAVPSIRVDAVLLEQALLNLIDNALSYTPPGSPIRIGATYTDEAVELWVEDEGPGVPSSELTAIFGKYHRLSKQNAQGAGLGLAISKGFVDAMDGMISAQSPASGGQGLKVFMTFPRAVEAASS